MMDAEATRELLRNGPVYMDFLSREPVKVWIIARRESWLVKQNTQTRELGDPRIPGLVWVLCEASCVSRTRRGGYEVTFCSDGAMGWYPESNLLLERVPGSK